MSLRRPFCFWPVLPPGGSFVFFHYRYLFYSSRAFIWCITHPCIPCNKDLFKISHVTEAAILLWAIYGHQGAESPRWIRFLEAPYPYLSLCQIPEFFYFVQSCYAHWGFPGQLKAQNCATTSLWGRANLARFDSTWRKKYKCYDKSDGSSEMLTKFLIRLKKLHISNSFK